MVLNKPSHRPSKRLGHMSEKTPNQKKINDKLTNLLNTDANITNFNMFAIELLKNNLAAIEWDEQKFSCSDGSQPYWFFIKGGTALRLIFNENGLNQLMPNPSDWDTQIVINPEYDFDTWYEAYNKVEVAVNQSLVMANMVFTLLPNLAAILQETFPEECNALPLIADEWSGNVKYRSSADRKTVYLYEVFHPLQPADTARRRFANLTPEQWADSGEDRSLFDELFPRETVEFNQLQYRALMLWKNSYSAFREFITDTKWGFSPQGLAEIEREFNFFRWSMERVTNLNVSEAKDWLESYFGEKVSGEVTPADVQAKLKAHYSELKEEGKKIPMLLASGQRTLIIDEFYLFRLMVRYRYHKPKELVETKSPDDYRLAWTSSGNLRGELIDVTIPRRDTYEAQHHGEMLASKHWEVTNIAAKIVDPSDPSTSETVALPVLSDAYQVSEQVLMIREILVGKSSSPSKIAKRLARGFALASSSKATGISRSHAREVLIKLINEQFVTTYTPFANNSVNNKIKLCSEALISWAKATNEKRAGASVVTKLKIMFDKRCSESATDLLKTDLGRDQLKGLTTFIEEVFNVAKYPKVWSDDQTNAGMLDFFMIVTVYAALADQIQTALQSLKLDLSIRAPRRATDAREVIKAFCRHLVDEPNIYPQVSGRAASFYHLSELDKVFVNTGSTILVNAIDMTATYFYTGAIDTVPYKTFGKKIELVLTLIGSFLVSAHKISRFEVKQSEPSLYSLDIEILSGHTLMVKTYMRVALDYQSWWNYAEYQTEYAFGLPVIKLTRLIQNLQYQVSASEFSQSQRVKSELKMLQQALSVREFSHHSDEPRLTPPLKRRLSHSNLSID